jgi:ATP-dependent DNA helicase Rep
LPSLNPQQLAAITTLDCPLLVLAGAGSGKTRVITEKIVHLIKQGMPARHIAALTFTNKAAREMKSRVGQLIGGRDAHGLRVSTFHALGLDIVRAEHAALGYKANLSVFDERDRETLLGELVKQAPDAYDVNNTDAYAGQIGRWKNQFVTANEALGQTDVDHAVAQLYDVYSRQLKAYNAVDFDDLILLPGLLFRQRGDVLEKWRNRIRYLLVDEYQDTNLAQYQLLRLLTGSLGKFTVVGDDDQSIYAWRGAQSDIFIHLQRDYPRLKVVKLEQNYRSTGKILKLANQLIANNPHVLGKRLWSRHGPGDTPRVLQHDDDIAEARQIAADIIHHKFRSNAGYRDYAILYRGNHQSRPFERSLREQGVPYYLSGGTSFFSYAEIKDVMAYLRLLVNHDDDAAFVRIVNIPRREIGPQTLEKLVAYAKARHINLFSACFELGFEQYAAAQTTHRLRRFCEWLIDTADRAQRGDTFAVLRDAFEAIGYASWLKESSASEKTAERRIRNVKELIDWLERLAGGSGNREILADVIAKAKLLDTLDRNREEDSGDRISLMTLHAAKGLEFPHVYLVGVEENLLPHQTSIEQDAIEEERRLAYVGITRAQKTLTLSYCRQRTRYGERIDCAPSRFLHELPKEELEWAAKGDINPEVKKARGNAALSQLRNLLS